jgi:hypothetical protein
MQLLYFLQVVCMHSSRGSCIGSKESLCGFRALVGDLRSLLGHSFVSDVSSHFPCLRGPRMSSSSDLYLSLSLDFDRLLEFLFTRFFSISFLSCYNLWVLSTYSSRGRLSTMCGSRTGGWILLGVTSD